MGCFLIGVTGEGFSQQGDALLGSVSDDPYDIRTFMKLVKPRGCLAHLGTELISTSENTLTQRGYFARPGETTRGINEAGLSFTCAMIIEDSNVKKNVNNAVFADITDQLMMHSKNVNDALELFSSKQGVSPAYSVLLADAQGDLAHIEVGSFGIAINHHFTSRNPGAVYAVNCYLSPKFKKYNSPETAMTFEKNNNKVRRERGQQLAKDLKDGLNLEALTKILSDHKNCERDPMNNPVLPAWGYSICNHGTRKEETSPYEDFPWGTVSAEILQPSQKKFWYAYGWPCGQKPEYGDQLFQKNSWGKFIPFSFPKKENDFKTDIIHLTSAQGELLV